MLELIFSPRIIGLTATVFLLIFLVSISGWLLERHPKRKPADQWKKKWLYTKDWGKGKKEEA